MKELHKHLMHHSPLYIWWHKKDTFADAVHWFIFILVALTLAYVALSSVESSSASAVIYSIPVMHQTAPNFPLNGY